VTPDVIPPGCDQCVTCLAISDLYETFDTCPDCSERHCAACSAGPAREDDGVTYRTCRGCAESDTRPEGDRKAAEA
jgi:hypothetical protein